MSNSLSKKEKGCQEIAICDLRFYLLYVKYFKSASHNSCFFHILSLWKEENIEKASEFDYIHSPPTHRQAGGLFATFEWKQKLHISAPIFPFALNFSFDDSLHEPG